MNGQDLINEIRQKTDIVDIIGERISLVKRGKNYFGVCPFHDDTNPSMSVSKEKQIYTCFSCHATGNVFTFLMNYEHKEFKEVLHDLGERLGIEVKGFKEKKKSTKYDTWYEAYRLADKFYQNNLMSKEGEEARKYLEDRKIEDTIIKEFGLGYSLFEKDSLTKLLTKKGYSTDFLNQIGLSVKDYDLYHNRLMFPLHDLSGNVIGFSGRVIKKTDQNKYINTKETDLFKKGKLLYHYHIAKDAARVEKCVLIMEGFMDIIRASTIGVRNTVATMGTALTKDHIQDIKRLSPNIILCFDGDAAGEKATLSAGALFQEAGIETKVIALQDKEDPDTYILKYGEASFRSLIKSAEYFSDYKIRILKRGVNTASSEEKANYINEVLKELSKIKDEIRIEIVLKDLAKNFEIGYNTLEKRFQELKGKENTKVIIAPEKAKEREKTTKYEKASYALLYYMLEYDWAIEEVEKKHVIFPNEKLRALESEIVSFYTKYGFINQADFYTYLAPKEELLMILSKIECMKLKEEIEKEELTEYIDVVISSGRKEAIKRLNKKMKELVDPLEQAKLAEEIRILRMEEGKVLR